MNCMTHLTHAANVIQNPPGPTTVTHLIPLPTWHNNCDSPYTVTVTHLVDLVQQLGKLLKCGIVGRASSRLVHSSPPARPDLAHHLTV
ncbi:hypothetical protein Pcinc_003385 [Petrolisthes cinctipes]|uniref:Uncharacterized protein n=1 Tax=Petrolisthes cinctipes TaxID=88211 RepID=A0AAE1GHW6_PETCI|nr:hypothetical protein Pcinc_003354 [Petrolisthes cinctipes]KAK3892797.1 hypothetical protein Pcinc_003385 [Petrolisthes cinctipes]